MVTLFNKLKENGLFGSSIFLDNQNEFFKMFEHHNPSEYDQIMGKVIEKLIFGGGGHRHFDGSHTLKGSYDKIKKATGEVDPVEYFKSHLNELVTPEGIPLFNLDKGRYETISNEISEALGGTISPGKIRGFIGDFDSFNAGEVCAASINSRFLWLAFRSGNPKAISRVTAGTLVMGMAMANPLQLSLGVRGLAYGLCRGKIKSYELLRDAASPIAGIIGYQAAKKFFNFSKNGSIIFSIGISITAEMLINHIEKKKQAKIIQELGEDRPQYITAMTPDILAKEFEKLSLKSPSLGLGGQI